ncbi:uncharacterized protein L3040_009443 [Drepanopeziza brunnea f. sp. 'multigermtubi']|uniref:uncharacterized protein n=1 Tax=Drepanopeziza brunnea f. sp. 'multigermtubi' TaxID=698441 RepID=UPI00238621F0|nr:hypothetical protein L3040_009443 [Drepanopeziza brunnea f. sp. 'multigermtubi']
MTAQGSVVVRLPRAGHGEDPSFVLLQVSSAGSNPLDVNLVGTENSTLFSAKLRHNQIATLKTSKVSQDEWENVLLYILLGIDAEGNPTPTPEDIEAVAKIDSTSMTISIQKNIEGITQKLGIITLAENENAAGDLYEWCGSAVLAKDSLMNYLQSLKAKFEEKDAQIKKLEESLAEMAQMKHENETQLLQKFSLLLNEKKLKIRDQQRLLQSSKVDAAAVKEMEETRLAVRSRPAGASRKGKQTADEATASEDEDDEPFPPTTRKSARVKAAVSSQKIKFIAKSSPVSLRQDDLNGPEPYSTKLVKFPPRFLYYETVQTAICKLTMPKTRRSFLTNTTPHPSPHPGTSSSGPPGTRTSRPKDKDSSRDQMPFNRPERRCITRATLWAA